MNRDEAIRHFMRMPDEQFTFFATHEVAGLQPEAVEIVRNELKRRGTVSDPDAAIDVQLRQLSSEEFERMVVRFRQQPCPLCGGTAGFLNGARAQGVGRDEVVIACVPCLRNECDRASGRSSVAPWLFALMFPHFAVHALFKKGSKPERSALETGEPTQTLREYVWINRGEWAHLLM